VDSKTARKATLEEVGLALLPPDRPLQCLSVRHIRAIDDALVAIGDYGEVRLVKSGGKLRFIQTLRSRVLKGNE
jgi:hypothetical protein